MVTIGEYIAIGLGITFIAFLILSFSSRNFSHRFLGWHCPSGDSSFDGATVISRCAMCGMRIGQDSQGNWFAFSRQDSTE